MRKISHWFRRLLGSFSFLGLVMGVVFFSISLSPSLLPRPYILQGILSGLTFALGYGVGLSIKLLWNYLQLPQPQAKIRTVLQYTTATFCFLLSVYSIYASSTWQNDVRALMSLPALNGSLHLQMTAIAISIASVVFLISLGLKSVINKLRYKLHQFLPTRFANVLGVIAIAFTVFIFTNNFMVAQFINSLDNIYAFADENSDEGIVKPINNSATGSRVSLVHWSGIGSAGQSFLTTGPTDKQLSAFFGIEKRQPLRVYVGLRSRESVEERAQLVLDELIRVNAFERKKMMIATPTGTGWLDPSAMDTFEYIHGGDTVIASMQYSYLPSWLTLLVDPKAAKQSAAVLYDTIHAYWSTLPKETRPELYVFGLSLGALGAETSINITTILNNPIQGGLMVGTPFPSTIAPMLTKQRNDGSPQWLPLIQDSSLVRFTNQNNHLIDTDSTWGPMRFVYIQYASDPMVFFSLDLYRREPDWMKDERGHDVSPEFKWYPLITFMQLLFDLPMADKVPRGNAHSYSADSYLDGWIEVSQPHALTTNELRRIKDHFANR